MPTNTKYFYPSHNWHYFSPGDKVINIFGQKVHTIRDVHKTGRGFSPVVTVNNNQKYKSARHFVPANATAENIQAAKRGAIRNKTNKKNKSSKCCTIMGGRHRYTYRK